MTRAAAVLPATEVQVVHSSRAGHDYQISVALPYHYDDEPDRSWPVIYVLDANLYFGMVVEMVRAMNIRVEFCDELPDAFVVGIGYPVEGSLSTILHEVMHRRMRDFLPGPDPDAEDFIQQHFPLDHPASAGNVAGFWSFLCQELVPLIESEYRTDPGDRTLLGHSWGGTFAAYTLFRDPPVFQRYVIVSSNPDPDAEAAYGREHDRLPVRLHWVMEESDPEVTAVQRYLDALPSRYADLRVSHQVLDRTHCAVVAPAFQAGLVAVFS